MKNSEKFSDSDKEFYRIFSRIFQFYDRFTIERKCQLRRRNQTPNLHSSLSTPYLRHERVPAFPRDKPPSLPPSLLLLLRKSGRKGMESRNRSKKMEEKRQRRVYQFIRRPRFHAHDFTIGNSIESRRMGTRVSGIITINNRKNPLSFTVG